jgi:hypothetical protein
MKFSHKMLTHEGYGLQRINLSLQPYTQFSSCKLLVIPEDAESGGVREFEQRG